MEAVTREDELGSIATTLLFENERVRVWEMTLEPGEACKLHRHVHDYLWIDVTPSRKELLGPYEPRVVFHDDGFVQYNVVGKGGRTYDTGIRNVGEGRQRQIVVELLGESISDVELEPENNGRAS